MEVVSLFVFLESMSLAIKELLSEQENQEVKKETDWFRKRLLKVIEDIHESTGVSELILSEVLEKIDAVHSKLEQKNADETLMANVLKSYIDNDIKQMLEGDLCDQQKWILIHMYHNGFSFTNTIGGSRWLPEPNLKIDDLADLNERKLIREYNGSYLLTRKGKEAVEKGFIFTSHWTFVDLSSRKSTDLPISSSNLQILNDKKKELEKTTGQPDWSTAKLNAYETDWFKFQRPNGETRKMIVKNGSLDFEE